MKPSCSSCHFFHPNLPASRPQQITFTSDGTYGGGECRRHPPRRDDTFPLACFPIVACDWWCGEFAPRDQSVPA